MASFKIHFTAPRLGNFYAVCVDDSGKKLRPADGSLADNISYINAAINMALTSFPVYSGSVKADLLETTPINILIYERMGLSPSSDDLLLAHEEAVWNKDLQILLRSSDPTQILERIFSTSPSKRLDSFSLNGSRPGYATVIFDQSIQTLTAKLNFPSTISPVAFISLRIVDDSLNLSTIVSRQNFSTTSGSIRFSVNNQNYINSLSSGLYAICAENINNQIISFGSPTSSVTNIQAGLPGTIEVTTRGSAVKDLRKF